MAKTTSTRSNTRKGSLKQIFTGRTISVSGDFGPNMSHTDMARWITGHGGVYTKDVTNDTTILISTMGDFRRKSDQGRLQLNGFGVLITLK